MEQFLYFSHACGMPKEDVNFLNCSNESMEYVIENADFKVTQFTGSSRVAERIAQKTNGRVRVEDAGFDWKVLGPDVSNFEYVCWQSDQDAYAATGQKCSAQSVVFMHENWQKAGFVDGIKKLAARRKLDDLTCGPIITWDNKRIKAHIDSVMAIKGAKLAFGGNELKNHKVPSCYGTYEPTAIEVPLDQFIANFDLCTTELFGPFQIIVPYKEGEIDSIIASINRMKHHLTAGVTSNDPLFLDKVLGQTTNGVTYSGIRARTTGAPQNHWFGPAGDPRGAGLGTKESILTVWTTHREIVRDYGPVKSDWKLPPPS